jgi:hypothetical protein
MLCFSLIVLSFFILIIVLAWHFVPLDFALFYSAANNHYISESNQTPQDISTHTAMMEYSLSMNTQQRAPDISSSPLPSLKEELSVSVNAQVQVPDDPLHEQDPQYGSCDSFPPLPFFIQMIRRFTTRLSTAPLQRVYNLPTSVQTHRFRTSVWNNKVFDMSQS